MGSTAADRGLHVLIVKVPVAADKPQEVVPPSLPSPCKCGTRPRSRSRPWSWIACKIASISSGWNSDRFHCAPASIDPATEADGSRVVQIYEARRAPRRTCRTCRSHPTLTTACRRLAFVGRAPSPPPSRLPLSLIHVASRRSCSDPTSSSRASSTGTRCTTSCLAAQTGWIGRKPLCDPAFAVEGLRLHGCRDATRSRRASVHTGLRCLRSQERTATCRRRVQGAARTQSPAVCPTDVVVRL